VIGVEARRTVVAAPLVSGVVTVIAVIVLGLSLSWARLELDDLGLVKGLPATYYLGLALLPLASWFELRRADRAIPWLIVVHVIVFIVVVWITPTILEGTPRFRTGYSNYGYVDPILRGAGLLPSQFIYHNWPLFPILMAGVVQLGVDPLTLLTWFPLLSMLLYLIPLAAIIITVGTAYDRRPHGAGATGDSAVSDTDVSAHRVRPPYWAFALWVFPILDWTGQDYFSPQSFAFLVFLVWALVLTRVSLIDDGRFKPVTLALVLGLFLVMTSAHVLTALLALSILFTFVLTRLLRQWTVFITCAAIFLFWQVYLAAPFFDFYRNQLLETILDLPSFLEANFSNRIRGSEGHSLIAQIRVLSTLIAFGLGAVGAAVMFRRRSFSRPLRFVVAYVLGVAIVAPITVYGGEMLIRSLLFVLPIVAAVVAVAIRDRRFQRIVLASLVVMAPVHILTHYGNELYDYVSPGELAAFDYIATRGEANIYGGSPAGNFQNTVQLDTRNSTVPKSGGVSGIVGYQRPLDHAWAHEERPIYVVISRGDDAAMHLFQDIQNFRAEVEAMAARERGFERVLGNEDATVYRWTPPPQAAP
jgi:hypothetical protein